jgi:hypothetical protein
MGHRANISPVCLIFVAPQWRLHRKMAVFREISPGRVKKKAPSRLAGRLGNRD